MSNSTPAKQYQKDELDVRIFDSIESMATDAAEEAKKSLVSAINEKGEARAIIATGNSQDLFLEKLIKLDGIDWSKVTLFHMDEYLGMSVEHPASFRKYLKERVADVVNPAALHLLDGDAMEPLKAIKIYSALLNEKPIDICCLGIGENGHIAFNDPAVADFEDPEVLKFVKLDEGCRQQQVGEGHFPNMDAVPMYAITLTIPTLCNVGRMICVVPETRKAQAVKDSLEGPIATTCPGSFLRTQKEASLFLEPDSASLLS